ncbi:hypothetical protein [Bacillus toyonensis]|uniref:hypothetical protein n=1 Tax=Bacillus toyonensis TaxID=155322 RepID=UPI000B442E88|nr:hypothetical protein [Bacillus toyonensis]MED3202186.1 hypothetical protein [Bacillus toyonensis]OTX13843.1 hypothetical protein BK712_01340 [Bacillus thuringiensis serovar seoulensis]
MDFNNNKNLIMETLTQRGATKPCSRCGQLGFSLLDGFFNHSIMDSLNAGLVVGGPSIPVVITACNHCGHLNEHAAGALGLLEK